MPKKPPPPQTAKKIKEIRTDTSQMSLAQLLIKHKITPSQYESVKPPTRKPYVYNDKTMNQERNQAIILLYKAGQTLKNIGKKYDLTKQGVGLIIHRRRLNEKELIQRQHWRSRGKLAQIQRTKRISEILGNQDLLDNIKKEWQKGTPPQFIRAKHHLPYSY